MQSISELIRGSNNERLLITVGGIIAVALIATVLRAVARVIFPWDERETPRFWTKQIVRILTAIAIIALVILIWVDQLPKMGSILALITAGVAVALQRVITSIAGYLIILRSRLFTVGDRITIGGVRGDVVALDFMQTTVLEMGQSPPEQSAEPAMWVHGRQFTGRIVRITNDKIFDSPVYNFTREFPYIWEEMRLPIRYDADRARVEKILLDVTGRHTREIVEEARGKIDHFKATYPVHGDLELEPRVFWRLTDNWLELTVRFISGTHGVRMLKDAMSRDLLDELDKAGIGLASTTFEIVGMPPLQARVDIAGSPAA
ncbi:MAG TPA: mechanosensitive ion channel domain-containing protein [Gemmatimonadaceae bacterium]